MFCFGYLFVVVAVVVVVAVAKQLIYISARYASLKHTLQSTVIICR